MNTVNLFKLYGGYQMAACGYEFLLTREDKFVSTSGNIMICLILHIIK